VKTAHDAHICLASSAAQDAEPVLEIFLGGWDNKMSGIRRDRAATDKVREIYTINNVNILDSSHTAD
jgi:hypothetical protein